MAVPIDRTGTASVEAVKALPVPGVQKPTRWVGKQFRGCLVAAPEKKVEKPAGLQRRPSYWQRDRLGAFLAVGCGVADCQVWRLLPYRP